MVEKNPRPDGLGLGFLGTSPAPRVELALLGLHDGAATSREHRARMRGHAEAIGGRKAQSVRIEQDVNSKALHRVVADDKTARTVATHEEHAPNEHSIDAICAGIRQEKSE